MALVGFEIVQRSPFDDGRSFGNVGAYERIEALAHYAVDPGHCDNAAIVDLQQASCEADGKVHFSADVSLVLPLDRSRANGALLLELPNRGKRTAFRAFNRAPADLASMARLDPGDGFLLERGWCVAWPGWQWDVPRGEARLGLDAPDVDTTRIGVAGDLQIRFQVDRDTRRLALTDQHLGPAGAHVPISPARVDDPGARLLIREALDAEPTELPRTSWRFVGEHSNSGPATQVALDGGFHAGRIYDLIYRPARCPVVGAGLLAVRDFASWIRHDPDDIFRGAVRGVIAEGQSQCGRLLRTLLHLGLHVDEEGEPVIDGMLIHVAGGRRGEFNMRYGQPSVQPTPGFGHLFPFADEPQADPQTGEWAGLHDRAKQRGAVPKLFQTDTASEYWRGDAGLTHVRATDGGDVTQPPQVRRYTFASAQHGPGEALLRRETRFGGRGANPCNLLDYRPLFRAALENLRAWVLEHVEPPPGRYPRAGDGTSSGRAAVLSRLRRIPGFVTPEIRALPGIHALDLGPEAHRGIGRFPARVLGDAYPAPVSEVDDDGNEVSGLRMPDLAVPVATHTGFNPRHPSTGGAGQILEYIGSSVPFPLDDASAAATGDPRPSLAHRYAGRDDYLAKVRAAARELVAQRYLLAVDVETCVDIAAVRYDEVFSAVANAENASTHRAPERGPDSA